MARWVKAVISAGLALETGSFTVPCTRAEGVAAARDFLIAASFDLRSETWWGRVETSAGRRRTARVVLFFHDLGWSGFWLF